MYLDWALCSFAARRKGASQGLLVTILIFKGPELLGLSIEPFIHMRTLLLLDALQESCCQIPTRSLTLTYGRSKNATSRSAY